MNYKLRLEKLQGNNVPEAVTHAMSYGWSWEFDMVLEKGSQDLDDAYGMANEMRDRFGVRCTVSIECEKVRV